MPRRLAIRSVHSSASAAKMKSPSDPLSKAIRIRDAVWPDRLSGLSIPRLACMRCLTCAGLACCISFPVLADEASPANPENSAQHIERGTPSDQSGAQDELRGKGQKLSPDARTDQRKALYDHWNKMPPEERDALRKKMKEHWEQLPPGERKARRREMHERWKQMSPEERDQFKRDMGKQDER
jgi:hypothetical protein